MERTAYGHIFFDWDGCLASTLEIWLELYRQALKRRAGSVELNPGAAQILRLLKRSGRKIAILTGSRRGFVEPVLVREGLAPVVDLLIAGEDVRNLKPHPEAVQRALAFFPASREQTLLVGDSSKDIEMGRNAAVATVLEVVNRSNQRGGRMLSAVDLVEAGTFSVGQAAWLLSRLRAGSSWLVEEVRVRWLQWCDAH